jgi:hypothetical protein
VAVPLRALGFRVRNTQTQAAPEVAAVERAVEEAAGKSRRPVGSEGGQGFMVDPETRVAVEAYAMALALQHYTQQGTVKTTALKRSWDYEVDINGDCWHVEVKGTTGDSTQVLLTPKEVDHARNYPYVSLYVVSNVDVHVGQDGEHRVSGGEVTVLHPWRIDQGELKPLGYKYRLPEGVSALESR